MGIGTFASPQSEPSGPLTVPEGKTLTIAPGAVIKGQESGACAAKDLANPTPCSIFVEGALDAVGTASEPITFTSINDNSIGGITGSGKPAAGDWGGIYAGTPGSVDVEHANVSYAFDGVQTYSTGATVLKNDSFSSSQYAAATVDGTSPTLEGNSSKDAGAVAFSVWSEALNMNLLGGNSATGGTLPVVQLDGQLGPNSTLPAEPAAWEVGVFEAPQTQQFAALEVPEGKTLTIAPGAVIKGKESGACAAKDLANPTPCSIFVEGALDAVGTASEPITFTSINDNSIGGITGSGKPAAGDWGGLYAATYWGDTAPTNAGSIDLEHAKVSYAYDGVETYSRGAATVLKSDAFVSSQYAAVTTFGTSPTTQGQLFR